MPDTWRHRWRHVSEDGSEAVEVEHGIADGVLVDAHVALPASVELDQSFQGLGLEAAQSSRRSLDLKLLYLRSSD